MAVYSTISAYGVYSRLHPLNIGKEMKVERECLLSSFSVPEFDRFIKRCTGDESSIG